MTIEEAQTALEKERKYALHENKQAFDIAIHIMREYQKLQSFKWCTDCKEYDQDKHCCHRYSKVIRDTVEEMKQEQEPILDKIKAEIESKEMIETTSEREFYNMALDDVLHIIDKYKA